MKRIRIVILIAIGIIGIVVILGWLQAVSSFDSSTESSQRDHLLWKLEGAKQFDQLCEIFDGKEFSGEIVEFEKSLGKGAPDIVKIKFHENSDSIFFQNILVLGFGGRTDYEFKDGFLITKIRSHKGSMNYEVGDVVRKNIDSRYALVSGLKGNRLLDVYHVFEDVFSVCDEVQSENLMIIYKEYARVDSLSRFSNPISPKTKKELLEIINSKK